MSGFCGQWLNLRDGIWGKTPWNMGVFTQDYMVKTYSYVEAPYSLLQLWTLPLYQFKLNFKSPSVYWWTFKFCPCFFFFFFFKQSVCFAVVNCCSEYSCLCLLLNICKNFSRVYTKICNWFIEYSSSLPLLDIANFSFQFKLRPAAETSLEQTSSPALNIIKFLFVCLASLVGVKYYFIVVLKIFWCWKSSWFGSSVKT